eukprot:scaffold1579_cov185-Isochrysis_galbana.AAC.1
MGFSLRLESVMRYSGGWCLLFRAGCVRVAAFAWRVEVSSAWVCRRSPVVYRLTTPTHRGGVMCKALAGRDRCSGQQSCRHRLALRP